MDNIDTDFEFVVLKPMGFDSTEAARQYGGGAGVDVGVGGNIENGVGV